MILPKGVGTHHPDQDEKGSGHENRQQVRPCESIPAAETERVLFVQATITIFRVVLVRGKRRSPRWHRDCHRYRRPRRANPHLRCWKISSGISAWKSSRN